MIASAAFFIASKDKAAVDAYPEVKFPKRPEDTLYIHWTRAKGETDEKVNVQLEKEYEQFKLKFAAYHHRFYPTFRKEFTPINEEATKIL